MKRYKFLAIALMTIGMWSCSNEFKGDDTTVSEDGRYEEVLINLTSTKGQSIAIDETRVHVGSISGSSVTHYWDEGDKVGIFTLNSNATKTNNLSQIDRIMENKNRATFAGMITTDNAVADYDLFVYYPYSESLLVGATEQSAKNHLANGVTFRVPHTIEQSSYSNNFNDVNHPSRLAMSTYGVAYDLVDCKGTVGTFDLNHVNTYLQFNVIGKQTVNNDGTVGTDFGNGNHRLSHVIVEVGTVADGTFDNSKVISGQYTFKYNYNESTFVDEPSQVSFTLSGDGGKTVRTNCSKQADGSLAPALTSTTRIPVFSMINTSEMLKDNTINCLKVSVTTNEYNESGSITKVNTRVRYYNIASTIAAGGFKGGDFYSINFEMSDPVEQYTHLDADGNSNCYIIPGPGKYTFYVGQAGNGKQPHPQTYTTDDFGGIDPMNLIDGENFKLDWLWASGRSFDAIANANPNPSLGQNQTYDDWVVDHIIQDIALSGKDGIMQFTLSDEQANLSGNVMVALYQDADNDNVCDASEKIVWSWHLWLGAPDVQHYKFANTDNKVSSTDLGEPLNNEDWYMFDRNLGAESNELGDPRAAGLYYQSGRKDPFIGYNDQTGSTSWASNRVRTYLNTTTFPSHAAWKTNAGTFNVANVVNYPMSLFGATGKAEIFTYGWVQGTQSTINNSKTFFDPCPPGYKLPTTREWDNFKNSEYYNANASITKTGVFGYCAWNQASFSTNAAGTTMKARVAAGDYYEVNAARERTYHILANSGTGAALTTTFPNTGWLSAAGTFNALKGTTSTSTVTIVGAPQLSNVSGVANTTITQIASPTVLAEAITDGESTVVTETKTVTISSASRQGNTSSSRYFRITLEEALPDGVTLYWSTNSNGTGREVATMRGSNYPTQYNLGSAGDYKTPTYVWISADGGQTFSSSYATISYSNSTARVANGELSVTTTTGTAAALTGYRVEMSRLAGQEYYWTTNSTFSTTNALTATQFVLETTDTDIYIWATDGTNSAYTRLQYSNGTVTATKQNASTVSTTDVDSYTLTISNWDAAKRYFWTTTPTFATTNEIESATVTLSTSSEQIYIWAQKDGTASQPSIIFYRNSSVGFTNGTPATDSSKTEITNSGGVSVLWSTGRINNNAFEPMWFGPANTNLETEERGSLNPYTTYSAETMLIMYGPNGVGGANNNMTNSPAAAVRCIREYNVD